MINSIRNTVLSVLNKNNYGYISPSDFNLYALQAQMELYEEYFSNYNKDINMENSRMSGSDYADISRALREVLESFLVSDFLYPVYSASGNLLNRFYSPSLITTGNEAYMIENLQCYTNQLTLGSNTSVASFQLVDHQNTTVESVLSNTVINLNDDIFTSPGEDYRVYSASVYSEVEKVHPAKLSLLSTSTLTSPSLMFPAYEMKGNNMIFYPTSIKGYGVVKATYFRYPKPPKWTYVSLSNGEPSFDQSQPDYQDFEMPQEDEFKLAMKILQYCGMSIREIQVTQFAQGQEQHEQPSFSQQI